MNKKIRNLIVISLILLIGLPSNIFAEKDDLNSNLEQKIDKYFTFDVDNNLFFDKEAALRNGESKEFIKIADGALKLANEYQAYESRGDYETLDISGRYYGNWCGPGWGGGKPIDNLDKYCKDHDICYREVYYHSCSCDRSLLYRIKQGLNNGIFRGPEKEAAYEMRTWLYIKTTNKSENGGSFSCK